MQADAIVFQAPCQLSVQALALRGAVEGDVEVSVIHSGSGDVHLGGRDIVLRDMGLYSQLGGDVSVLATGKLVMQEGTRVNSDAGRLVLTVGSDLLMQDGTLYAHPK